MSLTRIMLLGGGAASSLFAAGAAQGQAFYLQEQSARAAGRAFSGEAADTGAASLWWNPAAIAGLTQAQAMLGSAAILPHGDVVDRGTLIRRPGQAFAAVGGDATSRDPISNGVLPSGAVAMPLGDRLAVGLAITSPFSFTTDYPATSWARYTAGRTKLVTFDLQPTLAIAPTGWLRVGGAIDVEHSYASFSNALPNILATQPDGEQVLQGAGWNMGWSAGGQVHVDRLTIGVSYRSSIRHTLGGSLVVAGLVGPLAASDTAVSGITASFRTPSQVVVGARLATTGRLTLDAQYVRFGWSSFDRITLGAPLNTALPQNYRDSWSMAGGLDYALSPRVTLRAGVQRAITPTQDGLRDARVPDADRWNVGAGGSYRLSRRVALDAAANYVAFADASIDRVTAAYAGTAVQTPILADGALRNAGAVVLSTGARLTF